MTFNFVRLPTQGPTNYRGKYPYRMRQFSNGGDQRIHSSHMGGMRSPHFVELNNGNRYYLDGFDLAKFNLPIKRAELIRFDWVPVLTHAKAMSQEDYDKMLEAIRQDRIAREKASKRVTMTQEGGDDGYCWAVRVDARLVENGLTRREALYYKDLEMDKLMEKTNG